MQHLTPVGLGKDGRLVLVSDTGEEFAVPVDTRLRAALRGDTGRLGQLEMKMESALRPRDIQARIRAGESPEEVATAAQTTVEAIMGFATPVLAERAHVAQNAQKASVRRRTNEAASSARTLGDCAELFFSARHLHDEDVEWDSWRRPDGRWALVARYDAEGRARTAEFTHDVPGRFVVAENDEARVLTGELSRQGAATTAPEATPGSASGARRVAEPGRRLSAVPSQDELPLGDDALEMVRDSAPSAGDEPTVPVADPAGTASGRSVEPDLEPTGDADWITADGAAPVDEPLEPVEEIQDAHDTVDAESGDPGAGAPAAQEPPAEEPPARTKRKGRSSVPSWDEIMFGGGQGE